MSCTAITSLSNLATLGLKLQVRRRRKARALERETKVIDPWPEVNWRDVAYSVERELDAILLFRFGAPVLEVLMSTHGTKGIPYNVSCCMYGRSNASGLRYSQLTKSGSSQATTAKGEESSMDVAVHFDEGGAGLQNDP